MPQADDRATRTTRQRESNPPPRRTPANPRQRASSTARDQDPERDSETSRSADGHTSPPRAARRAPHAARKPSPAQIARAAAQELTEIMGVQPSSISGLERVESGWLVQVEVVELARIPDSTSVMASYHVVVDDEGALQSYRRERRYYRNQAGDV